MRGQIGCRSEYICIYIRTMRKIGERVGFENLIQIGASHTTSQIRALVDGFLDSTKAVHLKITKMTYFLAYYFCFTTESFLEDFFKCVRSRLTTFQGILGIDISLLPPF